MFHFVQKLRTADTLDETALSSATDTASLQDAMVEEETDTILVPNAVLQEKKC